jgi:16S rRNA (guanine527-N7)-methyltransferase
MSISQPAGFADLLRRALAGITEVSARQAALMQEHYELLLRWNARLNLTRITDLQGAVERHYAESVFVAHHLPPGEWKIADVGSGAGFPGIPVAVMRPECTVFLIESHQRKAVFLHEATRNLPNTRVVAGRAETVSDVFDWTLGRAVTMEELTPIIARFENNAAILGGPQELDQRAGLEWSSLPLPWGRRRFLHLGIVTRATE